MQIGFNAPTAGPLAATGALVRIVTEGEAMGFDYATVSDHVVIPTDIHARYPYSDSGEFPAGARAERHEQLIEVAFLAAKTTRLRLVMSVMVVPHRPAVLAAKMLSTIDVLSAGRLVVGIGAGWMKEEFEAIGAPDFARFAGEHVSFENIVFAHKPVQKPHPPIWVGGESGPALRRTARLGDAWYPIGTNPINPLDSLARFKANVGRLRKMTAEAGRKPESVGLALRCTAFGENVPAKAGDGERRLFSGKPAEIAGDIKALRDMGVGHLDFGFGGATAEALLGEMQKFRKEVLALV